MIRAFVALAAWAVMLYGAFLLGQVNMRRKQRGRDPLPVIRAARSVVTSAIINADRGSSPTHQLAVRELKLALDDWDLGGGE